MANKELKKKKISDENKENIEIQGQGRGCWEDCNTWYGYTTTPKCEFHHTPHDNFFS